MNDRDHARWLGDVRRDCRHRRGSDRHVRWSRCASRSDRPHRRLSCRDRGRPRRDRTRSFHRHTLGSACILTPRTDQRGRRVMKKSMSSGRTDLKTAWPGWWVRTIAVLLIWTCWSATDEDPARHWRYADQMTHQLLQRCGVIFRCVSVYRKDPRSADDVSSRRSAIGTLRTSMLDAEHVRSSG